MQRDSFPLTPSNPYQIPEANLEPTFSNEDTVWRDGKLVVVRHNCALPARCVKCNAPVASQSYKKRTFYYHHPLLVLLIFLWVLIYLIVALLVRKRATHQLGLCPAHHKLRLQIVGGSLLGSILAPVLGAMIRPEAFAMSFLVMAILIIVGIISGRSLRANNP
jgi:hypothetical protein